MVGVYRPDEEKDPWKTLRDATVQPPAPAPAPQAGGGGGLLSLLGGGGGSDRLSGGGGGLDRLLGGGGGRGDEGGFLDMLGTLGSVMVMMDPQTQSAGTALAAMQGNRREERRGRRAQNETAQWLQSQGVGPGEASFLASHPTAMNSWYTAWKNGNKPDWQIHELFNDKGQKQKFMVDMKTGNLSPLGGSEVVKPKLSFQTSYDQNGNETRVLVNEDTGEIITQIGGAKSDLLTEPELAQKKEIAEAGRPSTAVTVETKGQTKEAETVGEGFGKEFINIQKQGSSAPGSVGTLKLMEAAVKSEGFTSGAEGQFLLKAKQWAKTLGWDPEGLTSMEMFNTLSKAAVFDKIGSLGTGISNADRQFIDDQMPNLNMSRGGNLAAIEIQKALLERQQVVAKMARDYRAKTIEGVKDKNVFDAGFYDELQEFSDANPLFTPQRIAKIMEAAQDQTMPGTGGGGETGEPEGAADDFVPVPGQPNVRVRRGTTPPAVVTPVTPPPAPQVEPPAAPSILPDARQPRVRSVVPPLPQPAPSRFR